MNGATRNQQDLREQPRGVRRREGMLRFYAAFLGCSPLHERYDTTKRRFQPCISGSCKSLSTGGPRGKLANLDHQFTKSLKQSLSTYHWVFPQVSTSFRMTQRERSLAESAIRGNLDAEPSNHFCRESQTREKSKGASS